MLKEGGFCMEKPENIFKISADRRRAKELIEMAEERLNVVVKTIPESVPYKFLEEYYEIVVQLITSIMYSEGYKTLSHVSLIKFISEYGFSSEETRMLDKMRKYRHGTVYYGDKNGGNFYINHEEKIKRIVDRLLELSKQKSKW